MIRMVRFEERMGMSLREYAESLYSKPEYKDHADNWVFGAIDFAFVADLIDESVYKALVNEYHLLDE